ncbi:hypothetical protein ACFL0Q_09575, partial [Thermodesulfobacteriota bacterium]
LCTCPMGFEYDNELTPGGTSRGGGRQIIGYIFRGRFVGRGLTPSPRERVHYREDVWGGPWRGSRR